MLMICFQIGGLTVTLLLDCDEIYMRQKCEDAAAAAEEADAIDNNAVTSRRISEYKHKTLPVLGYLEDVNKLDMILVRAVYHRCILLA